MASDGFTRQKSRVERTVAGTLKKRRYIIATTLFSAVVGRLLFLHYERHRLYEQVIKRYDTTSADKKLNPADVIRFLKDNGVNLTKDQFASWVGNIDNENDGFDMQELLETVEFFDDFDSAKKTLTSIGYRPLGMSAFGDLVLIVGAGAMLAYVLFNSESVEKKLAATSFVSAVKMSRMQRQWQTLESQIEENDRERNQLSTQIEELNAQKQKAAQRASELEEQFTSAQKNASLTEEALKQADEERKKQFAEQQAVQEMLDKHKRELEANQERQVKAESELKMLRTNTEKHMQEAHMSTNKLKAMHKCLRGINAVGAQSPFHGAGEGKYMQDGAKSGFAMRSTRSFVRSPSTELTRSGSPGSAPGVNSGFKMESFVFGYPTEDDVVLYEVDRKRDFLGEGVDGAYKCRDIATNDKFALKIYEIASNKQKRQILNDLRTKQSIREHPHIVKYHNVIETQEQIYVLMELIPGKDLFGHIVEQDGLTEKRAASIFVQICEALKFCHDSEIIHGDMKPENVMIVDPESAEPKAKLIDFGFACFLNGQGDNQDRAPVYDVYSPPEALRSNSQATKDVDLFRLGCTLYVMLMATYPFDRSCMDVQARKEGTVLKYPRWKTLSEGARDVITRLVRDRISVQEVLEHPWVVQNSAK